MKPTERLILRDFARRQRYLFLKPSLGIRIRRWFRRVVLGRMV